MEPIEVDCSFDIDGKVRLRRIALNGQWLPVEQGRQWRDDAGLHVLILLRGAEPREVIWRNDTLTWEMKPGGTPGVYVV